jgi:hypothetical protein
VTVCCQSCRTKRAVLKKNNVKAADDESMKKVIKKQKMNSPGKKMIIITPQKKNKINDSEYVWLKCIRHMICFVRTHSFKKNIFCKVE